MHRLATVHARDNQRRHDTAYLNKRLKVSKVRRLKMELAKYQAACAQNLNLAVLSGLSDVGLNIFLDCMPVVKFSWSCLM